MTIEIPVADWLRALFPDRDDEELAENLTAAVAWVYHYAPCAKAAGFSVENQALVIDLVKRAFRYDAEAGSGALASQTVGPFGVTQDTRRPLASAFFSPAQVETLRELCRKAGPEQYNGAYSVPLGYPTYGPR